MAFDLFKNILDKSKAGLSAYNTTMQGVGSKVYDWANDPAQEEDVIQKFLDDSSVDANKKREMLRALNDGAPEVEVRQHLATKYYPEANVEFKQTLPMAQPLFKATGKEGTVAGVGKMLGNIPTSAWNLGAGAFNLASTAVQEGPLDTLNLMGKGITRAVGEGVGNVQQQYQQGGAIQATDYALTKAKKYVTENPADFLAPPIAKGAGTLATKGSKALVRQAEKVAPKVVQGVKKMTPTLPKAEELLVNQLEKTNRMNPTKYTEFEQMSGQRAGKFLADRKITGDAETNVAKLYDNFTKSKGEADKGLSAIQKTYKPSEVPPAFNDMLGELEKRFTYTKDSASLAKVQEFKTKLQNGTLSHNDINGTKRLYEQKVKVNYIKDQNSLEVERATNIDNDVRTWQFDEAEKLGFGNLKEINKETQLNRYLADNIGDKIARQAGLNNISLTDWIIAGQVPATPQALALLAGKKFAEKAIPKLYQKGLEKLSKIQKKEAPVADIENINKMETIRKSVTPQYDTNRLLVPPRNSSRAPATITPDVTLPKGEKATPTTKSPVIKSDITSKSKIVRPGTKPIVSPKKPVEKTVKPRK